MEKEYGEDLQFFKRSLGFEMRVISGLGKCEYGQKCGPRGSIEAYRGMLAISEEKLPVVE